MMMTEVMELDLVQGFPSDSGAGSILLDLHSDGTVTLYRLFVLRALFQPVDDVLF